MNHPLDGVFDRLERTNENILNLEREICAFLENGPHPIIANEEVEAFQEAVDANASRIVPKRFSILSGEIIHHLRACLDHIAWELSSPEKREANPRVIEFPILCTKPINSKEISGYNRKVDGIGAAGRNIIQRIQPYHRSDAALTGPCNHPLGIIHQMDIIDKHRELVMVLSAFDIPLKGMGAIWTMLYRQADFSEQEIVGLAKSFNPNCKIAPQVASQD
jgi:hypothetical protein